MSSSDKSLSLLANSDPNVAPPYGTRDLLDDDPHVSDCGVDRSDDDDDEDNGDDDEDDEVENEGNGADSKLTNKTTEILSEYRSYLSEMDEETGEGKSKKKADVPPDALIPPGGGYRDFPDESEREEKSAVMIARGGESALTREWSYRGGGYRDAQVGDFGKSGNGSDEDWVYRSNYKYSFIRGLMYSKWCKRSVLGIFMVCVVVGTAKSAFNNSAEKKGEVNAGSEKALPQDDVKGNEAEDNEELQSPPPPGSISPGTLFKTDEKLFESIEEKFSPVWFDRSHDWNGQTYDDALQFCSSRGGRVPCPYEAICPKGPNSEPVKGNVLDPADAWAPTINSHNSWVQVGVVDSCVTFESVHDQPPQWGLTGYDNEEITRHIMCCKKTSNYVVGGVSEVVSEESDDDNVPYEAFREANPELAHSIESRFHPNWFDREHDWNGRTYLEAVQFCDSHGSRILCPYEVICPLGEHSVPLKGFRFGSTEAWAPMLDTINGWLRVSKGDSCVSYRSVYDEAPEWGLTGEDNEKLTRNIMCCQRPQDYNVVSLPEGNDKNAMVPENVVVPDKTLLETDPMLFESIKSTYNPVWFNRAHDWNGQTYDEAVDFCDSRGSRMLCPYEVICPLGEKKAPVDGYREGSAESWTPMGDFSNGWVRVSTGDSCVKYESVYDEYKELLLTGEDNEELTRNIICCRRPPNYDVGGLPEGSVSEGSVPEEIVSEESVSEESVSEESGLEAVVPEADVSEKTLLETDPVLYESIVNKFFPTWFDRTHDWNGQTYDEAVNFCESRGSHILCPYEVICPLGENNVPMDGYRTGSAESWAPVLNSPNGWVRVSSEGSCLSYNTVYDEFPEWGLTGENNEELTRNIMCCKKSPSQSGESYVSVMEHQAPDYTLVTTDPKLFDSIQVNFHPVWFDRISGWNGQTYDQAVQFCSSFTSLMLCPYEVICPLGEHNAPLDGYREGPSESWAPMGDFSNGWVRVSSEDSCLLYNSIYDQPPEWGLTGEGNEELTRNVLCCKRPSNSS